MSDAGLVEERAVVEPVVVEPVAVGPGPDGAAAEGTPADVAAADGPPADGAPADGIARGAQPTPALSTADASLLSLIDRLSGVLERSDLGELEVSSGGTTIVLRAPSAIAAPVAAAAAPVVETPGASPATTDGAASVVAAAVPAAAKPAVKAPLTGIYYGAPSPGATAYVAVGDHVSVGQIIGLIEAMKLFNEIKSDLAGRVTRICVDNGALVKAKQPLIEVEPA